jgi:hypothetical protein
MRTRKWRVAAVAIGTRREASKGPVEMLVVEYAERPSDN